MKKLLSAATLFVLALLAPQSVGGADLKVCTTGCAYTTIQPAIDAAAPGDVIILEAKEFIGSHVLKVKTCAPNDTTCFITIRAGVSSTGTLLGTGIYPAANVGITPAYASVLPKLKVASNNVATLATETGGSAVAWYKLQWLEFLPNDYGGNTLIQIGSDSNTEQPTCGNSPNHIYMDQIYVHGDSVKGQFRGISLHGRDIKITNSYVDDIKAVGEGQAVWANSAAGPLLVENNYLSGGAETFFTGGSSGSCRQSVTVVSNATTTSAVLSAVTELTVLQDVHATVAAVAQSTQIQTIGGSTCTGSTNANCVTWSPALTAAPDVPGTVKWGQQVKDLIFRLNHVTRPLAWRNAIVGTPTGLQTFPSNTGGNLATGTHYYKVIARHPAAVNTTASSAASAEISGVVTAGPFGSVRVVWTAVPNATTYYVYAGSSGGQNRRFTVTAPTVEFTDTGAVGTTEVVSTGSGTKWQVKNTWEVKNLVGGTIEGNVIENAWVAGQSGNCVLFTGSMQNSGNVSATVRNIIFRKNIVRQCAGFLQISGRDALGDPSGQAGNIAITDNWIYDTGSAYGSGTRNIIITVGGNSTQANRAPYDVTINHNTFDQVGGNAALYMDTYRGTTYHTIPNFIVTNNIFRRNAYGLFGNATEGHITEYQGTGSVHDRNVWADASCAIYPAGSSCPTSTALNADFTDFAGKNFIIRSTSPYYNAGLDGKSYGADIPAITALTDIALSRNNSGSGSVTPLVITTGTNLPSVTTGVAYSTTIAVTGGTPTYTRSVVVGALPAGMSLTPSTGVISGTGTVPNTYTFTIRATDAAAAIVEKVFTLVINAIVAEEDKRPAKTFFAQGLVYAGPTAPTPEADRAQVGDLWSDTSTNTLKLITSTTPSLATTTFSAGGEVNTASNAGAGVGLVLTKAGVDLPFKTLVAGTNISLTSGADTVTVAATGGGSGEANTTSNAGAGLGIAKTKVGVDLPLKSLVAGTNISLTSATDTITITGTAPSGEANTTSNAGAGVTLAKAKSGVDLPFKTLVAGTNITLTAATDTVTVTSTGSTPPQTITFYAGTAVATSNIPLAGLEFPGANRNRVRPYLVGYTQCALTAYFPGAAVAATNLDIEYFDGSTWQKTGITVVVGASGGAKEGAYQTLAAGARTDLASLRAFLGPGDDTTLPDPTTTSIHMTCKP